MITSTSKYKNITCDPEKCIGCQLCEYICSYTKTGEYNTYRSRIHCAGGRGPDDRGGMPDL